MTRLYRLLPALLYRWQSSVGAPMRNAPCADVFHWRAYVIGAPAGALERYRGEDRERWNRIRGPQRTGCSRRRFNARVGARRGDVEALWVLNRHIVERRHGREAQRLALEKRGRIRNGSFGLGLLYWRDEICGAPCVDADGEHKRRDARAKREASCQTRSRSPENPCSRRKHRGVRTM